MSRAVTGSTEVNGLIDHSPIGAFQGQRNQMMKQIVQMNITWLKIPIGGRLTSWLFTKRDRGVELRSTEKRLQLSGQSRTWTCDLQALTSTTQPPSEKKTSFIQNAFLDAGQLFPSSHVWNTRPSFSREMLQGQRPFFSTWIRLLIIYIF